MSREFKNILVVRTDRIGDVILTTPALSVLRKAYPQARITLLVTPVTRDLVSKNPDINEVIVDDRSGAHRGAMGFFKLVFELKSRKFDLAIIFHTKKRTNSLCFFAGIPRRIGYKNEKFGSLLTDPLEDKRHEGKKHEAEYCLDVLKSLGIGSTDLTLNVSVHEDAEQWVEQFVQQNRISKEDKLIAIHPGASDPSKRWPESRFAELIDMIVETNMGKVVLVGEPNVRSISREIMSLTRHKVYELTGLTTIAQLVSLLNHADILVSNDSGPVHIAAGLGRPVVSIFTRNLPGINPERWGPLGKKAVTICVPKEALDTFKGKEPISFKKAQKTDQKYLELIPAKQVFEAVDSLFKLC